MNKEFRIRVHGVQAVQELCLLAMQQPGDIVCKQDIYAVNAKSILGLFSLDLTKPLTIVVQESDETKTFCNYLSKLLVTD
jgi:phosphotransferase system HPr-like phosphotransfer protein